ncbi:MAG TPA: CARDB domain-containing protein [Polyangiaceae bacterium]|nr:CARDB domain-containing protein [Polyangiaceae bacterium]
MRFRLIFAGLCLALVPAPTSAAGLPELRATQVPAPSSPSALPDLVVLEIGRPQGTPSSCLGNSNQVALWVGNVGRTATGARTDVQLQVRARAPGRVWFAHTATQSIPSLRPGPQQVVTFTNVMFPPDAERIEVLATADAGGRVAELSEANNARRVAFDVRDVRTCSAVNPSRIRTIGEAPDLVVTAVRGWPVAGRGRDDCTSTVRVTVTNRTGGDAGRPTVLVSVRQIHGKREGRVFRGGAVAEAPLGAGQTQELSVGFSTKELYDSLSDAAGLLDEITLEVDAVVTAHGAVAEARTDNNRLTRSLWVRSFMAVHLKNADDNVALKAMVSPTCPAPLPF